MRWALSVSVGIHASIFLGGMMVLLSADKLTAETQYLPSWKSSVTVELPEKKDERFQGDAIDLTVSFKSDGKMFLQEAEITLDQLVSKLIDLSINGYEERIYVQGDKSVSYIEVLKVVSTLNKAGFNNVALVAKSKTGEN